MHWFRLLAAGSIDQTKVRAAIRTACLAGFFYWQVYAGVRIPQLLFRRRAGQGKISPVNFINGFFVGIFQAGISSVCYMCHDRISHTAPFGVTPILRYRVH